MYQCNVIFPDNLNIENFVSCKNVNNNLQLYAVISSVNGNIMAFCKNREDQNWYKYNNSMAIPCSENEYKIGKQHILFYQVPD